MATSGTTEQRDESTSRTPHTPIIEQSPTVDVGKRTFVILPGRLSVLSAKKLRYA